VARTDAGPSAHSFEFQRFFPRPMRSPALLHDRPAPAPRLLLEAGQASPGCSPAVMWCVSMDPHALSRPGPQRRTVGHSQQGSEVAQDGRRLRLGPEKGERAAASRSALHIEAEARAAAAGRCQSPPGATGEMAAQRLQPLGSALPVLPRDVAQTRARPLLELGVAGSGRQPHAPFMVAAIRHDAGKRQQGPAGPPIASGAAGR